MIGMLSSPGFFDRQAAELDRIEAEVGVVFERIPVQDVDSDARVLDRVRLAFLASDLRVGSDQELTALRFRFHEWLRSVPHLEWIQIGSAGVDVPIFGELQARGVRLSNSAGDMAETIAQTAITGLLMLGRGFPRWLDAQRRHTWEKRGHSEGPRDLRGQTILIVGFGSIGCEIGRLAQAIGLQVVGVRRSPLQEGDYADEWYPPSELPSLYPRADWLAVSCPLTEETRGIIDAAAIAALPRGARILNVSRGPTIDEPAMIEALRSGHLGGAYLDVFWEEPLPPEAPFWDMPNVIVTPHNAAICCDNIARTDQRYLRNLERWMRGEPLEQEL